LRDSWRFSLSSAPTVENPCRPLQCATGCAPHGGDRRLLFLWSAPPGLQPRGMHMRVVTAIVCLAVCTTPALAAEGSCKAQATEKKLAGAALKSFMTKCERDAKTTCETSAGEKKLAGAAKA